MNVTQGCSAPVLQVIDTCAETLRFIHRDSRAAELHAAGAAVAALIEAAQRAAVAAVRGDGNRPGAIRNADLDDLRAAVARVRGEA